MRVLIDYVGERTRVALANSSTTINRRGHNRSSIMRRVRGRISRVRGRGRGRRISSIKPSMSLTCPNSGCSSPNMAQKWQKWAVMATASSGQSLTNWKAMRSCTRSIDMYSPFIEDDETIETYLADIEKDGAWGSQLELQALSVVYKFNYLVHQVDNPSMAFGNYPWGTVPTLHVSYHLGEHYNSVRLLEDPCTGPALPIGHELKLREGLKQEDFKEEVKNEDDLDLDKIPTREEAIDYSLTMVGTQDRELMTQAMNDCFGKHEIVTYQNLEETKKALIDIYEDLEIMKVTMDFSNKVTLSSKEEEKKETAAAVTESEVKEAVIEKVMEERSKQQQKTPSLTDDEKLKMLQKTDQYILTDAGQVKDMPQKNKKCPCNSRKQYKNCACYIRDLERKTEFINKVTKNIEESKSQKGQSLLLL